MQNNVLFVNLYSHLVYMYLQQVSFSDLFQWNLKPEKSLQLSWGAPEALKWTLSRSQSFSKHREITNALCDKEWESRTDQNLISSQSFPADECQLKFLSGDYCIKVKALPFNIFDIKKKI